MGIPLKVLLTGLGMSAVLQLSTAVAQGSPVNLWVQYSAPSECPNASQFVRELLNHIDSDEQGHLHTYVKIQATEEGYSLKIGSNRAALSTVVLSDCQELYQHALLMASMARTDRFPQIEVPPASGNPLPEEVRPEGGASSDEPLPTSSKKTSEVGVPDEQQRQTDRFYIEPSVLARLGVGVLPELATGVGVSLALGSPEADVRLTADLTRWTPQRWLAVEEPLRPVQFTLTQWSTGLSVWTDLKAAHLEEGRVTLSGCLRVGAGHLAAESPDGLSDPSAFYASIGSHLGLAFMAKGFRAELAGGVDIPTKRSIFGPAVRGTDENRFGTDEVQFVVALSLGWAGGRESLMTHQRNVEAAQ